MKISSILNSCCAKRKHKLSLELLHGQLYTYMTRFKIKLCEFKCAISFLKLNGAIIMKQMFISSPDLVPSKNMMKIQGFLASFTSAAFGNFCLKSYFDKSHFQVPMSKKYLKMQPPSSQLSKSTKQKCLYFFEFFTLWYLKLRFVLKYFLDENSQKQPLCIMQNGKMYVTLVMNDAIF